MIQQVEIKLPAFPRGAHLITDHITRALKSLPEVGLAHIFLHHTSAGLMINENADPSVREDMEEGLNRLAPEGMDYYTHTTEGPDDMPAHIKSGITGVFLTIPVSDHRLNLGTWQGIFLCEFRNHGGARKITITITS